jgi:membrane associated rhomboid family serine protease
LIPLKDNIPTDRFPLVTVAIIAINVFVFLFLQGASLSGEQVDTKTVVEYGAIPHRVTHPGDKCVLVKVNGANGQEQVFCKGDPKYPAAVQVPGCSNAALGEECRVHLKEPPAFLTLFTSMFMHGGWLHIIFNMLFLWIFGNNVEDSMGRVRYILFYLLGGLAAVGAQVAVDANSEVPTVGASGAIAAVLGGYLILYPRARVLTIVFLFFFFTFIEIPAMVMLGIWVFLQFLPAVGQLANPDVAGGGGVAYFAHIGGFVFGMAAIMLFAHRKSTRYNQPRSPVY